MQKNSSAIKSTNFHEGGKEHEKTALLLLSLVLALGCLNLATAEATEFTDATNSYACILNSDDTAELVTYVAEPAEENVTIPSVADGHTVTAISGSAFSTERCAGILTITIPDSVTTIESNPFYECASLTIPDSVTTIEEFAFDYCNSLTIIGGVGSTAEKYCQANGVPFEPAK